MRSSRSTRARPEPRQPSEAAPERCRLYLITPPRVDLATFERHLVAALDAGDVGALQLRLKDASDAEVIRAARVLLPHCRARGVAFIVNDRPDLAARVDADGVHVGQEDTAYAAARETVGAERVVGVTCHASRHLALEAAEAGADYVAFGAFFPTGTKAAKSQADIDILEWWSHLMVVPCVAIGGITVANCAGLVRAGADFLAVVSGVWDHADGPAAAVTAFNAAIDRASPSC